MTSIPATDEDAAQETRRLDGCLWTIRIAAAVGLAISAYLLYTALTGQAAAGCGEGDVGCGHVLATRWSKVLGIPVSGPAIALYLIILAVSLHAGQARPEDERRGAWRLLAIGGVAAGGSAVWFIGLQLVEVGEVCWYCMAAHACSLIIAAATLLHGPRIIGMVGLTLPATLIALQLFVPPAVTGYEQTRITGIVPQDWPTLGNPDAPYPVALLFDYNCGHCLTAHAMLAEAVERYDRQICVVLLPTAINPRINEHVEHASYVSETTPEIARLALAVWLAKPDAFAEFDAFLIERIPRSRREGIVPFEVINTEFRGKAIELVGEDELDAALADPRVDAMFERTANVYDHTRDPVTGNAGVPRIIIAEIPYGGIHRPQDLEKVLKASYRDLTPADE